MTNLTSEQCCTRCGYSKAAHDAPPLNCCSKFEPAPRVPTSRRTQVRHASRTSDNDNASGIALCGVTDGRLTRPKETVNCPDCRVVLNHTRQQYPQHADYADWRLTRDQMRKAARDFVADMHGGSDD